MTPAEYQHGARGVRLRYTITDSLLGRVLVGGTESGISLVLLGENDDGLVRELQQEFPNAVIWQTFAPLWEAAVRTCQVEDPIVLKLPIGVRARIFQARVWNFLK